MQGIEASGFFGWDRSNNICRIGIEAERYSG
jgi:hypothetical protein